MTRLAGGRMMAFVETLDAARTEQVAANGNGDLRCAGGCGAIVTPPRRWCSEQCRSKARWRATVQASTSETARSVDDTDAPVEVWSFGAVLAELLALDVAVSITIEGLDITVARAEP